jgi:XisH protein
MARRDLFHDTVRNALEKEGWVITDDPLGFKIGEVDYFDSKQQEYLQWIK